MVDKMETEAGYFSNEKTGDKEISKGDQSAWQGIPGLTEYRHIDRIRKDRINRWLGPDGAAVATEEFDWNKSFAPVIEQLSRVKEEELLAQKQAEAEKEGVDVSDVMKRAEIAHQVSAEVADEFSDVNALYNTISKNRERLKIIAGGVPPEFQNLAGVKGADNYFLVQGGSRADNEKEVFTNLESLNNAGGNIKLDRIFSHLGGVTEGHGDKDFFGWKLTVGGHEFVFVWNPDESDDKEGSKKDVLGKEVPEQEVDGGDKNPSDSEQADEFKIAA